MTTHEIGDAAWGETTTPPLVWSSGHWRLELRDDELADIAFDGRLAVRSIRGVARDRDWGTIPPTVTSVTAQAHRLAVEVSLVGGDADLRARLVVEANGDALDVGWECRVEAPFLRSRLGLVVLHPPAVAGDALTITHSDGGSESSGYPLEISPHQPVFDIAGLDSTHDGLETTLSFSGDVFEMEDQRNWTDASFKTYSTPLALPLPVQLEAGAVVTQGIRISCAVVADAPPLPAADRIALVPAGRVAPAIGTSASTGPAVGEPAGVGDFLLVELPAHTPVWRAVLDRAVLEADGLPLDVRIVAASVERLDEVLDALSPLDVVRVGAFSADSHVSEPQLWTALAAGLAARGSSATAVGGTRAHFTELNRTLGRLPDEIGAHTFSITPQMHATGRQQIVESVAMQRLVANQAVRMTRSPVHIGPVTLRSRFNAVATTRTADSLLTDLDAGYGAAVTPEATDPRQTSPAVLAWTVASAAALAVAGVETISWFEASGPRGLRDGQSEFPVATALRWLAEIAGRPLLEATDAPAGLWAIGATVDGSSVALVANLRDEPATVALTAPGGEQRVLLQPFEARRIRLP
jgi:hypothetical protein